VRFANDALRVKVLEKNGHTEVDLMQLPEPMTKEDAVAYLQKIEFWKAKDGTIDTEVQAAIEDAQDRRTPKAAKPKTEKPARAPKTAKPTMAGIEAKVAAKKAAPKSTVSKAEIMAQLKDVEDAPF
jgi:hypothetical protein